MEPCPFQAKLEKQGKSDPRKLLYSGKMEHPNFDIKICLILQEIENVSYQETFLIFPKMETRKRNFFIFQEQFPKPPKKVMKSFFQKHFTITVSMFSIYR